MHFDKAAVVLRTLFFSLLVVALTFTTLAAGSLLTGEVRPRTVSPGIPTLEQPLRAFTIRTGEGGDFPGQPNISAKAQQERLDEISAFAKTHGFNAVLFEAVPDGAAFYRSALLPSSAYWTGEQGKFVFFDPLDYLTQTCKDLDIQVYAVVNPFAVYDGALSEEAPANQNPNWTRNGLLDPANEEVRTLAAQVAGELTKNYDIAGVVLSQVDSDTLRRTASYPEYLKSLAELAKQQLHDKKRQRLGMVVRPPFDAESFSQAVSYLDFLVPSGAPDPVKETGTFMESLAGWQSLCEKTGLDFYPLHAVGNGHEAENAAWLESRHGAGGLVVSHYGALRDNRTAALSLAASFRQQPEPDMPDFSFPKTFAVTRPTETLYLNASLDSYFVTGTSVPGRSITADGAPVTPSPGGLWGHQVPLAYGKNTFTFSQDGVSETVVIVRSEPPSGEISTLKSVYPANPEAVLDGRALQLSCTAPAGGTVTVTLGGLSATLQPIASNAEGIAVKYQGQLDVTSLSRAGQVTDVGPVTYHLSYRGVQSSQPSAGRVYIAGPGAEPVARMKLFGTMVNKNAADDGQYTTILRQGCVDIITDNVGSYYGLSLGGYILKSAVEIETGETNATAQVTQAVLKPAEKGEKLALFVSRRPAYKGKLTRDALTLNIRNITGWENIDTEAFKSELCSAIESEAQSDGSVTITFRFRPETRIAGWDVLFGDDGAMAVYLRRKPEIDWADAAPLSGVTIALDPGHGGSDPGAMGIPGSTGPTEALLNLANSYALRSRLSALGADVHILQENTDSTLDNRLALAQKLDADLFISSHHNSLSETVDSNSVTGVEVYYWNDWSASFAENIGKNLSAQTGRKLRAVTQSWYRVTMMNACPAVLVESGFVCNPTEYEDLASEYSMYRYAAAVTDAVLQYFAE